MSASEFCLKRFCSFHLPWPRGHLLGAACPLGPVLLAVCLLAVCLLGCLYNVVCPDRFEFRRVGNGPAKGFLVSALKEQLEADLKQAMRAQNALETSVLRMAKSALQYKAVEPNAKPLTDMDVLDVLRKLIKQRKDAAEQFRHANREELASKEESEILILQRYLPQPLSAEELACLVRQTIEALGVSGPKNFGLVMKKVMEQLQGRAEGKAISEEVKKQLG